MSIDMDTLPPHLDHSHGEHDASHRGSDGACCEHVHIRKQTKGALLDGIVEYCQHHSLRLTTMRKLVLEVLFETHQPLGAYDLLNSISHLQGKKVAPVTIYRALDFLVEHHFAHKLETLNAYIPCTKPHIHPDNHQLNKHAEHNIVFLICDHCGGVDEINSTPIYVQINVLMENSQFKARNHVLEFSGTCHHCQISDRLHEVIS